MCVCDVVFVCCGSDVSDEVRLQPTHMLFLILDFMLLLMLLRCCCDGSYHQ